MNDKEKFPLVRKPTSGLEKVDPGAKRVLSSMVSDALTLARVTQRTLETRKFRVGDVDLCEPDYLQIRAWAEQLGLSSFEVLRRLKEGLRFKGNETRIENGKFTKLNWDPGLLPVSEFQISFELEITQLSFAPMDVIAERCDDDLAVLEGISKWDELSREYDDTARILRISSICLSALKQLDCACIGLECLAIEFAPSLERLDCTQNCLSALNLRPFPNLKELLCLSNLIEKLDLCSVPKLRKLNCDDNDMQELVLPNLPELVELDCVNSGYDKDSGLGQFLKTIDLRGAPNLERLNCFSNRFETLNLSCVPKLKYLDCSGNPLAELALSDVPLLETLKYSSLRPEWFMGWNPPWIGTLDIRGLSHLKKLECDKRTRVVQRPDQHFASE